jgi:hypothetical protein
LAQYFMSALWFSSLYWSIISIMNCILLTILRAKEVGLFFGFWFFFFISDNHFLVSFLIWFLNVKSESDDHISQNCHYNMWHLNVGSKACIFMLRHEWINAFGFSRLNLNFLESLPLECANHIPQNGADFYRK